MLQICYQGEESGYTDQLTAKAKHDCGVTSWTSSYCAVKKNSCKQCRSAGQDTPDLQYALKDFLHIGLIQACEQHDKKYRSETHLFKTSKVD